MSIAIKSPLLMLITHYALTLVLITIFILFATQANIYIYIYINKLNMYYRHMSETRGLNP